MGTTASNEQGPENMNFRESNKSEEDVKQPENLGKNKIISILGLDDHENVFESTDSDISEINDSNKNKGQILYFHETTFQSNSTLKANDYCMRNSCGAGPQEPGDFINIIDGINNNEMNNQDCEMDCGYKLSDKTLIKRSPHSCISPPHCNVNTCPAWNNVRTKHSGKFRLAASPDSNICAKECPMSASCKKDNGERVPSSLKTCPTCDKFPNKCDKYLRMQDKSKASLLPSPKLARCLQPKGCAHMQQHRHNAVAEEVPTPYTAARSHNEETTVISEQQINSDKIVAPTKSPVQKKMHDMGTNTSIPEEPRNGAAHGQVRDPHMSSSKPNPNALQYRQSMAQSSGDIRRSGNSKMDKFSSSYTYDEQTTESSAYTNYDTETRNTSDSIDSPFEQMYGHECRCKHMEYHRCDVSAHKCTTDRTPQVSTDPCSNDSDQSNNAECMNLAYQRTGDYPVLVNELESTLSERNRNTTQHFEILSRYHRGNFNPSFADDPRSCNNTHQCSCYDKECYCQICTLHEYRRGFENSTSDSRLKKKVEAKNDHNNFELTAFPASSVKHVIRQDSNFMYPQPKRKGDIHSKIKKFGNRGWRLNARTGDWEKEDEIRDFDRNQSALSPLLRTFLKQQDNGSLNDKKTTCVKGGSCMCPSCPNR